MNKTIPFQHAKFAKTNNFRESNTKFHSVVNLLFFIFNQTFYKDKIYDINSDVISKFVIDKYNLHNLNTTEQLIRLVKILDIHIIYCPNRNQIQYLGYPYDKNRQFIIIYEHNTLKIPLMLLNGGYLFEYNDISFIFHNYGKIQSSLRLLQYSSLQKKADEYNIAFKSKEPKKKRKIDLYEELKFYEDTNFIKLTLD